MNKLLTLLLLLVFVSLKAKGQDSGFLPGYIITNSNDTIHGLVKYINLVPYRILTDIKFKENGSSKSKVYPPDTIVGYEAEGKIFHSLKTPDYGESEFMELIIDGYIRLYRSTVSSFGASQPGLSNSSSDFLLKSGDQNLFDIRKGKFKERLSEYLSDNVTISDKIKSGEFKKRDIEKIVKEYNISKMNN